MRSSAGQAKRLAIALTLALIARILLDIVIVREGYYFGEDPDSFWRLGLAWRWSQQPFFATFHWVPLQFVLLGTTFSLLRPLGLGSSILVPVVWNHCFFLLALGFAYLSARKVGGRAAGVVVVILATTMTEDIWTTYSALSEPLTTACFMAVGYFLLIAIEEPKKARPHVLAAGLVAGLASANHYLGWGLVPVSVGLAIYHCWGCELSDRSRPYLPAAASLFGAGAFPVAWLVSNLNRHGDPLFFLQKAQEYHPWVEQLSMLDRLAAIPHSLISTAPWLFAAGIVALAIVLRRKRRATVLLIPAAAYLLVLTISSLRAYGVPDMHNRYALVPAWLVLPLIGIGVSEMLRSGRRGAALAGLALVLLPAAAGLSRIHRFENSADPETVQVIEYLEREMQSAAEPGRIVLEIEPCLYPIEAVANSLSQPDVVQTVSTEELLAHATESAGSFDSGDLLVLTNPLAANALQDKMSPLTRIGDYRIAVASQAGATSDRTYPLPEPWRRIDASGFQQVEADGTIYFGFDPAPAALGSSVGLQTSLDVGSGGCRILHAQIQDRYEGENHPWAVSQQLVVNDIVLWSNDPSGANHCGWRPLDVYLMPTTSRLDIQLRATALTGPGLPVDWRTLSLTGVRQLSITECP